MNGMKNTRRDVAILTTWSLIWTGFMAGVTVGMFYLSGIDPRNDFWGGTLASIGVLVIPLAGWPAGLYKIWFD